MSGWISTITKLEAVRRLRSRQVPARVDNPILALHRHEWQQAFRDRLMLISVTRSGYLRRQEDIAGVVLHDGWSSVEVTVPQSVPVTQMSSTFPPPLPNGGLPTPGSMARYVARRRKSQMPQQQPARSYSIAATPRDGHTHVTIPQRRSHPGSRGSYHDMPRDVRRPLNHPRVRSAARRPISHT